jgi:RNA 3'-terminal phosphate cyclase (ATP)
MAHDFVELDGSLGEGGGQILRSALALSLLTGKPFRLQNIRSGRSKPGLQPQHLASVRAAQTVGNAATCGSSLNSSSLEFIPGLVRAGTYRFDVGTAGATGLVLHTVYLPLALRTAAPSELTLVGGTHVRASPSFHFLENTWSPYLALMGMQVRLRLIRPGFYPRGGGIVQAFIQPGNTLQGLRLTGFPPGKAQGFSAVAGLEHNIGRRLKRRAVYRLQQLNLDADIREETWEGGPGVVLALWLENHPVPATFVALGERGKPAETIADELTDDVADYLKDGIARVDPHSADQIVLPLAFATGPSEFEVSQVTRHLTTNIEVIRRFLDREIFCEGEEGMPGKLRIT